MHTPGPWKENHWDNHQQITITALAFRGPNVLALVRPPLTWNEQEQTYDCTAEDVSEAGANARLMAAAPDLLAALKLAYGCVGSNDMVYSEGTHGDRIYVSDAIKAAIAKAEGGAP